MFKELESMKTLRYLLMIVAMVSVLGVYAQSLAQQPAPQMKSTSTMVGTGTTLPFAATEGIYVTGSTPGTYSSAGRPGHIRKVGEDDGFEEEKDPDVPENPYPLGDAWPLMLIALAYMSMRVILINKRKIPKIFLNE